MRRHIYILVLAFLLIATLTARAESVTDLWRQAETARNASDFKKAIDLYSRLIEITPDDRRGQFIDYYGNRALCYKKTGYYSKALADYNCALELTPEGNSNRAPLVLNLSDLYLQTGAYRDAAGILEDLVTGNTDLEAHRLTNLASAYLNDGRKPQAVAILSLFAQNRNVDRRIQKTAAQNLGFAHMSRLKPDYAEAVKCFNAALPFMKGLEYAITLSNKALAESYAGNCTAATADIEKAEKEIREILGTKHEDYMRVLRKKAAIALNCNSPKAAELYRQYFNADSKFLTDKMQGMSENLRLDYWKMKKLHLSEIFQLGSRETDLGRQEAEFLYDVALFRRQMTLLQHEEENLKAAVAITHKDIAKALKPGEAAIEIVSYYDNARNDTLYSALCLTREAGVRFITLWTKKELYNTDIKGVPLVKNVLSDVANDKNYIYTNDRLADMIWDPVLESLPAQTKKIYFAPDGLLQLLAIEYLNNPDLDGYEVYRVSSTARLAERSKSNKKSRGAREVTLNVGGLDYNLSPNVTESGRRANHEAVDLLKTYLPQGGWFKYLPGTRREAEHIDTIARNALTLYEVREDSVKQLLSKAKRAHFSTHGYALPLSGTMNSYAMQDSITEDKSLLASGLALSGANVAYVYPASDDEILSAKEISELDLHDVDFVVLSACQSAFGAMSDEGPAGLVRGFKKSGAKAIMATLWSVSDRATSEFMKYFYDGLLAGLKPRKALLRAQSRLRDMEAEPMRALLFNPSRMANEVIIINQNYNKPYYWAPFILIDDILIESSRR